MFQSKIQENKQDMTNSSRYNESLACEAFIQVNKVTGSTIFHCQKRTALRRRDRLKYPTLQNRNIYIYFVPT